MHSFKPGVDFLCMYVESSVIQFLVSSPLSVVPFLLPLAFSPSRTVHTFPYPISFTSSLPMVQLDFSNCTGAYVYGERRLRFSNMVSNHHKLRIVIKSVNLQLAELYQIEKANLFPYPSFTLTRMCMSSQENTCLNCSME